MHRPLEAFAVTHGASATRGDRAIDIHALRVSRSPPRTQAGTVRYMADQGSFKDRRFRFLREKFSSQFARRLGSMLNPVANRFSCNPGTLRCKGALWTTELELASGSSGARNQEVARRSRSPREPSVQRRKRTGRHRVSAYLGIATEYNVHYSEPY